jgi:hypothetical protein
MASPWLSIPLEDYEAHMESSPVQRAATLRAELRTAVDRYRPRSVAILGVAGGNGLSELQSGVAGGNGLREIKGQHTY